MLVFAIVCVVFAIAVAWELFVSASFNVCNLYMKLTVNKEQRSKIGWWIYNQYNKEHIETLKERKAC